MLTTLLTAVAIIQADEPRDFKFPVMSIEQYGQWLGKERNLPVAIRPEVEDRLIYINIKDTTLAQLNSYVERVAKIRVIDKNDMLTIEDTAPPREDLEFRYWEQNIKNLKSVEFTPDDVEKAIREVARLQGILAQKFDSKLYQQINELARIDPAQAFLGEFIRAIRVDTVRALPENARIVYSTSPTRLQRPWPIAFDKSIQRLNEQIAIKNEINAKVAAENSQSQNRTFYGGPLSYPYGAEKPVTAAHVILRRYDGGVNFELKLFDEAGELVTQATDFMIGAYDSTTMDTLQTIFEQTEIEEKITLTEEEQKELRRAFLLYVGGDPAPQDFDPNDLEWMATIDKVEPFSGVYSRLLDRACEYTGNQTVKLITTPLLGSTGLAEVPLSQLCLMLFHDFTKQSALPRNQLVILDDDLIGQIFGLKPLPRKALARAARGVLQEGSLTIDILADSVKGITDQQIALRVSGSLLQMSGQATASSYSYNPEADLFVLQAYADLPPAMRRQVWTDQGLQLPLTSAPGGIRNRFQEHIYRTEIELGAKAGISNRSRSFELRNWPDNLPQSEWLSEHTVFLTLPESQPIRIKFMGRNHDAYMAETKSGDYRSRSVTSLEEIAENMYFTELSKSQGGRGTEYIGLTEIKTNQLVLEFSFGSFPTTEYGVSILAQPLTKLDSMNSLAPDLKRRLDEELEKIKKEYGPIGGGGGRTNPPPPAP